ncbi:MAG: ATP-binding protein [Jaaginema sp. PMC 1079.18]|nr:ATP-binding protein [Jaaginema sp. PMC 1080.18]MEC4850368.1 ATP-binding protein [Jaaginema sp. PMC 1079.18]MEC4864988.1 ATP-binding protein [Jaaginema sp. PMC 1078.18]
MIDRPQTRWWQRKAQPTPVVASASPHSSTTSQQAKNLWTRLILGGTAVVVCLVSYWSYQTIRNLLLENLQDKAFLEAQQGANEIDRWISNHQNTLAAIANSPTFRTMDWVTIEPYLKLEEQRLLDFLYLGMTNADMMLYTTTTPDKNGKIDLSDRRHIQSAMAGVNSISDPLLARSSNGRPIVVFAIPTFSGEATSEQPLGPVIGALNAAIGIEKINEVVNSLQYGPNSYAFALNSQGEAIVHPNTELMSTIETPAPSLLNSTDPGLATVTQRLINRKKEIELVNIDGKQQYVAYIPLQQADWSVALVIPRNNIEGQLRPLDLMALVVVGLTGMMLLVLWRVQAFEQQQLKRSKTASDLANQAKSEFLANMSHELRTPLNGILGYAQILGRTLTGKERDGIDVIYQCGSHLLTLINDILDISKIEARKLELDPSKVYLPSLIQSVVEMCRIKAEQQGLDFVYQPSPNLPDGVEVDEKRLRQVLINLLGNAIKFTDRGTVSLQVEVLQMSEAQVSLFFKVMDTGIGIAPDDITKLFEAFEQVGDRQHQAQGTGLGLAISQRLVKLMGGIIKVKSQPRKGSEFFFTIDLPLAQDWVAQQAIDGIHRIVGYAGEQRYTLLIVDDALENRAVLLNLLKPLGFNIIEAENGQAALKILEQQIPDLIVTDLAMPKMDGFEFLDRIRHTEAFKDLKVLVSSASVSTADQRLALSRGGNDFLVKPVDAAELLKLLSKHLDLQWTYQTPSNPPEEALPTEFIVPSHAVLEELLALAEVNKINDLRTHLEQLKASDSIYIPFVESLLTLTRQFQTEAIEDLLHNYLTEDSSHV